MINIALNNIYKTTHRPSVWAQHLKDFSILWDAPSHVQIFARWVLVNVSRWGWRVGRSYWVGNFAIKCIKGGCLVLKPKSKFNTRIDSWWNSRLFLKFIACFSKPTWFLLPAQVFYRLGKICIVLDSFFVISAKMGYNRYVILQNTCKGKNHILGCWIYIH